MSTPALRKVVPNRLHRTDRVTLTIIGDVFTDIVDCQFGPGIDVLGRPNVINDGEVEVRVEVTAACPLTKRNVILTNALGNSGTLLNGIEVVT